MTNVESELMTAVSPLFRALSEDDDYSSPAYSSESASAASGDEFDFAGDQGFQNSMAGLERLSPTQLPDQFPQSLREDSLIRGIWRLM